MILAYRDVDLEKVREDTLHRTSILGLNTDGRGEASQSDESTATEITQTKIRLCLQVCKKKALVSNSGQIRLFRR